MPKTQGVPEIYADLTQIATINLGTFLGFHAFSATDVLTSGASDSETEPEITYDLKAVVRLTHEDAKIFAIMLKRALKDYEQDFGEIILPQEFIALVDLTANEW